MTGNICYVVSIVLLAQSNFSTLYYGPHIRTIIISAVRLSWNRLCIWNEKDAILENTCFYI